MGTESTVRSMVLSLVDLMPISITVPVLLPNWQKSPTCTGLSAKRVIPPITFSTVGLAAREIANPATPSPVITDARGIPSCDAPYIRNARDSIMPSS